MQCLMPEQTESTIFRIQDLDQAATTTWDGGTTSLEPEALRMKRTGTKGHRWGVILAGGDGTRLQSLTRVISGDDRPKQFCRVLGQFTLLEQSRLRAARSIPPEQTIFALTRAHEHFYIPDLGQAPSHRLIQPCNRGTAPPILLSLLHIVRQDRAAMIAVLPCDHFYSNESAFTRTLESGFRFANACRSSVVLLGAVPSGPEVEFGWIEVGAAATDELFQVQGFKEKPTLHAAERLFKSGALWNTFVMVGHVQAFLQMAWAAVPELVELLESTLSGSLQSGDISVSNSLYDSIQVSDFSRQVLSPCARLLLALRLNDMEWHDLGRPDRVVSVLRSRNTEDPPLDVPVGSDSKSNASSRALNET